MNTLYLDKHPVRGKPKNVSRADAVYISQASVVIVQVQSMNHQQFKSFYIFLFEKETVHEIGKVVFLLNTPLLQSWDLIKLMKESTMFITPRSRKVMNIIHNIPEI